MVTSVMKKGIRLDLEESIVCICNDLSLRMGDGHMDV